MKRVLIVDDALELGRFLQAALRTMQPPLESVVVPSAEEALLESQQNEPDLLIADIRLPGISGLELVQKIRKRYPDLKVILITGLDVEDLREKVEQLKVNALLEKPMSLDRFLEVVSNTLGIEQTENHPSEDPAQAEEPQPDTLSGVLGGLRRALDGESAFLLDDLGRVRAQAGELPAGAFDTSWMPPMMDLLTTANSLSSLLGRGGADTLLTFEGQDYQVVIAPVKKYALVLVMDGQGAPSRMLEAYQRSKAAQEKLKEILQFKTVTGLLSFPSLEEGERLLPPSPGAEETAAEGDGEEAEAADLHDFAELFQKPAQAVSANDTDDFWETQLEAYDSEANANPDLISYDQANKLGLIPEGDE